MDADRGCCMMTHATLFTSLRSQGVEMNLELVKKLAVMLTIDVGEANNAGGVLYRAADVLAKF